VNAKKAGLQNYAMKVVQGAFILLFSSISLRYIHYRTGIFHGIGFFPFVHTLEMSKNENKKQKYKYFLSTICV
jgi:hypothetical protein